jgi:hypothetical protein
MKMVLQERWKATGTMSRSLEVQHRLNALAHVRREGQAFDYLPAHKDMYLIKVNSSDHQSTRPRGPRNLLETHEMRTNRYIHPANSER